MKVVLYKINRSDILNPTFKKYLSKLDELKQQQIANYKNKNDKFKTLMAHLIVYMHFTGNIRYKYNNGKMYNILSEEYFNISHCDDFIAVAFSNYEVGIDIEKRGLINNEMLKVFSSQHELEMIHDSTKIWCLKESYLKKLGTNIFEDFKSIKFSIINNRIVCLNDPKIFFHTFNFDNNHICAISCDCKEKINIELIDSADIEKKILEL